MLEEYNDTQINPVIFQALKSAVYDGEGKQKRKDAVSKEIDSSQVNAALVIMGQESPNRMTTLSQIDVSFARYRNVTIGLNWKKKSSMS